MSYGTPWNQQQLNVQLTAVAQAWVNVAAASEQLNTLVAGSGGESFLASQQIGYDAADATAVAGLVGQFAQLAGLVNGTGTLATEYDFASAFALAMSPTGITV